MTPANGRLDGRVALVTGASSGIGVAAARALAGEGAGLILVARRGDRLENLAGELRATGVRVTTRALDVRDAPAVQEAIEALPQEWASIDILVNNAGLSRDLTPVHEGDPGAWREMIETNVLGLLHLTRAVLPGMVLRRRGHVVNLGSVAGREAYPGGNVYCATKSAVRMLNRGLRLDLAGGPVRVTTVDPGMVETEFSLVRFRGDEERASSVYRGMSPLRPEDVAEAILWCLTRPPHVNVEEIVLWPTDQASATLVRRRD
jgi:NADP-dependent 3-hydroxy acid dehydrogenase YdfG